MLTILSIIICLPLLTLLYVRCEIWDSKKTVTDLDGKKHQVPTYSDKDRMWWWISTIVVFVCTAFIVWLMNNWDCFWSITK